MMHYQYKLSYHCGIAAHLEDVVVDPEYRKRGIGEELVVLAMHTAMDKGCYKLMLTCYEKTIPYYEKLGFARHDFGMRMSLKDEYPS
jgi:glucosamine-phosphate N-acetyltransferase